METKKIGKFIFSIAPIIILIGCEDQPIVSYTIYNEGECLKEISKELIETPKIKHPIYRIDGREGSEYWLSVYNFNRWVDLRKRPLSYFRGSDKFEYQITTCPGKKPKRTIGNTIKMDKMKK